MKHPTPYTPLSDEAYRKLVSTLVEPVVLAPSPTMRDPDDDPTVIKTPPPPVIVVSTNSTTASGVQADQRVDGHLTDTTSESDEGSTLVKLPSTPAIVVRMTVSGTDVLQPAPLSPSISAQMDRTTDAPASNTKRVTTDDGAPERETTSDSCAPSSLAIPSPNPPNTQEASGSGLIHSIVHRMSLQALLGWLGAGMLCGFLAAVVWMGLLHPASASPFLKPTMRLGSGVAARPLRAEAVDPLADRVSAGDTHSLEALQRLDATERSVAETLAIARARATMKNQELARVAAELRSDVPRSVDASALRKLEPYLQDQQTAIESLAILASLGTPLAADKLYDIWTGTRARNETTELAKQLLYAREVRSSTSEALAILLDLRAAETCEQVREMLPHVRDRADRRALVLLGKLTAQRGCGPKGASDCYGCLRGTAVIMDTIRRVRGRPGPMI